MAKTIRNAKKLDEAYDKLTRIQGQNLFDEVSKINTPEEKDDFQESNQESKEKK